MINKLRGKILISGWVLTLLVNPLSAVDLWDVRFYWIDMCYPRIDVPDSVKSLERLNGEQWRHFKTLANSLMQESMSRYNRAQVIEALAKVDANNWEAFKTIAESLLTTATSDNDRSWMIKTLVEVPHGMLFNPQFQELLRALIRPHTRSNERIPIIRALTHFDVETWREFQSILTSASINMKDIDNYHWSMIIQNMGEVPEKKVKFVQSHLKRFFAQCAQKVKTNINTSLFSLFRILKSCDPEDRAKLFTERLILEVQASNEQLDDNGLLRRINTVWDKLPEKPTEDSKHLMGQHHKSAKNEQRPHRIRRCANYKYDD